MIEVEDDIGLEFEDNIEELEEELEENNLEESEGEEEAEGYASLSNSENDDYIGEEEENE